MFREPLKQKNTTKEGIIELQDRKEYNKKGMGKSKDVAFFVQLF